MTGKPDFTTPSDIVAQGIGNIDMNLDSQTLAEADISVNQNPAESVEFIQKDQSSTVSSSGGEQVTIKPPSGYIYELLAMKIDTPPPPSATSGEHYVSLKAEGYGIALTSAASDYTNTCRYDSGNWSKATNGANPSSASAQQQSIRGARFDSSNGLKVSYTNNTDASNSNNRQYRFIVRKIKVS